MLRKSQRRPCLRRVRLGRPGVQVVQGAESAKSQDHTTHRLRPLSRRPHNARRHVCNATTLATQSLSRCSVSSSTRPACPKPYRHISTAKPLQPCAPTCAVHSLPLLHRGDARTHVASVPGLLSLHSAALSSRMGQVGRSCPGRRKGSIASRTCFVANTTCRPQVLCQYCTPCAVARKERVTGRQAGRQAGCSCLIRNKVARKLIGRSAAVASNSILHLPSLTFQSIHPSTPSIQGVLPCTCETLLHE